jgi:uncharacterized RDD family membrane protein YckC
MESSESIDKMQGQYAGCITRLFAFVVDVALVSVTLLITVWLVRASLSLFGINVATCVPVGEASSLIDWVCTFSRLGLVLFNLTFAPIYALVLWTLIGQTIGKAVMGVRVVRLNGQPMNFLTSLRRLIGYLLTLVTFGLGFAWVAVDNRRQALHDKVAGTCVVYSWDARHSERLMERIQSASRRVRRLSLDLESADPAQVLERRYRSAVMKPGDLHGAIEIWDLLKQWDEEDSSRVARAVLIFKNSKGEVKKREPHYYGDEGKELRNLTPLIDGEPMAAQIGRLTESVPNNSAAVLAVVDQEWVDQLPNAEVGQLVVFQPPSPPGEQARETVETAS